MSVIKFLKNMNITSNMAYLAAAGSILLSIAMWGWRRSEGDQANAERFGIFVGLWAPTLSILGRALEEEERSIKVQV